MLLKKGKKVHDNWTKREQGCKTYFEKKGGQMLPESCEITEELRVNRREV